MLCPGCEGLFRNPRFSKHGQISTLSQARGAFRDFVTHHESYGSLQAALRLRCGVCERILRNFLRLSLVFTDENGSLDPSIDRNAFSISTRMYFLNNARTIITLQTRIKTKKNEKTYKMREMSLFWSQDQERAQEQFIHPPLRSDDETVFKLVSNWLSDCQRTHSKCCARGANTGDSKFSRILHAGIIESPETVRLCEASEVPEDAPYLTLSHCWGGAGIPVLSKSNYSKFLDAIYIKDLPQTFVDAIQVTRKLKYNYLWIDSLCIIQDSRDDWLDQSAKMGGIYRGSTCNISAALSKNPFGGLFSTRNPTLITPVQVKIENCTSQGESGLYDVDDDFALEWNLQVSHSPVVARGWVMQERLLAPRVVHFCRGQLFWECIERQTREADAWAGIQFPNSRDDSVNFKTFDPFSEHLIQEPPPSMLSASYIWSAIRAMPADANTEFSKNLLQSDPNILLKAQQACFLFRKWRRSHPLLEYWERVINIYCRLALTREDDRLVAITGLAKILSDRTGIRYVAGLWCYQLPRQLLWTSTYQKFENRDTFAEYVAPSWSWASRLHKAIRFVKLDPILEQAGAMDLVRVRQIKVEGVRGEENPMDRLKSAFLRLRGRLIPIELDLNKWPEPQERDKYLIEYLHPSVPDAPTRPTFLVPVLFFRWNKKLPSAIPNSLLVEATDKKGTYRRIGTARLSSLYPLAWIVANLNSMKSTAYEDPEDQEDASTPDLLPEPQETSAAEETIGELSSAVSSNPRDEWRAIARERFHNPLAQKFVQLLTTQAQKKASPEVLSGLNKLNNLFNDTKNSVPNSWTKPPGRLDRSAAQRAHIAEEIKTGDPAKTFNQMHGHEKFDVEVRFGQPKPERPPNISPKDAVGERYYLKYIEDERSVAYGHFIFDII